MCSYPPKKIHSQDSQTDRTTVRLTLTELQLHWQNHSQTDRTAVTLTEPQSQWQNHRRPGFDISKPYIPFTHMLQAHCLQSFSKQPIRIKDSSAVLNSIILLVDGQCHLHSFPTVFAHYLLLTDTHTDTRTTPIPSRLSAGNNLSKESKRLKILPLDQAIFRPGVSENFCYMCQTQYLSAYSA